MSCTWFYIGRVTVGDTGLLGCNVLAFFGLRASDKTVGF